MLNFKHSLKPFGLPDVVAIEIVYYFHKLDHVITCMVMRNKCSHLPDMLRQFDAFNFSAICGFCNLNQSYQVSRKNFEIREYDDFLTGAPQAFILFYSYNVIL